jgi:anti-sigma B factor antagonist
VTIFFREVIMSFPPEQFSVRSERTARVHRLTPVGELDLATAPILEEAFDVAYDETDADTVIVVDLRELEFIDSSGIRVLLKFVELAPGRLRMVNGTPAVTRLFEITGVRALIPVISPDTDPLAPLR